MASKIPAYFWVITEDGSRKRKRNPAHKKEYRIKIIASGLCGACQKKPRVTKCHCADCRDLTKEANRKRLIENREANKVGTAKIRREVIEHYGAKCACCGENEYKFLELDHINNDGNIHRRSLNIRGGGGIARWAKKNGFPENILQVLCANCNAGKARNGGICPHKLIGGI